jgi:hypothetical protein
MQKEPSRGKLFSDWKEKQEQNCTEKGQIKKRMAIRAKLN